MGKQTGFYQPQSLKRVTLRLKTPTTKNTIEIKATTQEYFALCELMEVLATDPVRLLRVWERANERY